MASATLTGHSISIPWTNAWLNQPADHTYVQSDGGHVWQCWGAASGGSLICTGTGDSGVADCISQSNSEAGISYGITGLCHQTANRILDPASVLVDLAKGYWASSSLYGTYGRPLVGVTGWAALRKYPQAEDFAVRLQRCGLTGGPPATSPVPPASGGARLEASQYIDRVKSAYARSAREVDAGLDPAEADHLLAREEARLAVDFRLGPHPGPEASAIIQACVSLADKRRALVGELFGGEIAPPEYARGINRVLNQALFDLADRLGADDYRKFFDLEPGVGVDVLDPARFEEYYGESFGTLAPAS